jgi:oxygen-independent coproporphyrinogen-3 oxidase
MTTTATLRGGRLGESLGLYVHVPFCRTRCRYCDFYRVGENAARMELFLRALHREIARVELPEAVGPVDSIFLGGGTPSLLTPVQVEAVLAALADRFARAADCEVSMEANPSDLDAERLAAFRRAGVNRLSLGVQSFCDRELGLLGRRHDARRAADCVEWARDAGFENLSVDLMLGIPGQTAASFRRSVERAIDLATDHVSVYLLEVHPGSEIDGLRRNRPGLFPSEEAQCRRYEWLAERLPAASLAQYEISNFARRGARCRHNLKYWRCRPFLGFGPSAHSAIGERRWRRPADLQGYLVDPLAEEAQASNPREEAVFLALRLTEGVALPELAHRLALGVAELSTRVTAMRPYLELSGGRVRFTVSGFLVSNAVLSEMLSWREEVA